MVVVVVVVILRGQSYELFSTVSARYPRYGLSSSVYDVTVVLRFACAGPHTCRQRRRREHELNFREDEMRFVLNGVSMTAIIC
jgi:hypothetical protein